MCESEARHIFRQIVYSIAYVHSSSVAHRDIKLDNVILDSRKRPKICDFGICMITSKGQKISERSGTPAYLAPEVALNDSYEGFISDVWSLGIVLYAMIYATVPFKVETLEEYKFELLKSKIKYPYLISEGLRDLFAGILNFNPNARLTIPEILNNRWLRQNSEVEYYTFQECQKLKVRKNEGKNEINFLKPQNIFLKIDQGIKISKDDFNKIIIIPDDNNVKDQIINKMVDFGFSKELILRELKLEGLNHIKVTYSLIESQCIVYKNLIIK